MGLQNMGLGNLGFGNALEKGWAPLPYRPGYLGAPPPTATVLEFGLEPTSKELRRIATNDILPLWTRLRDTVNAECPPEAPLMPRFTNIESAKKIPKWCWNDAQVQFVLLGNSSQPGFVPQGRAWVAAVNGFLADYGAALYRQDPHEVERLGEEFDAVSVRLSAVSDFTLKDPFWTFWETLPGEIAGRGKEMYDAATSSDFWLWVGLGGGAVVAAWVLWNLF